MDAKPVAETIQAESRVEKLVDKFTPSETLHLIRAWDTHRFYMPVVNVLHGLLKPIKYRGVKLLQVGGRADELKDFLQSSDPDGNRDKAQPVYEVHCISEADFSTLPFPDHHFDCAVALDWLPHVPPSKRQAAVAELCRVAQSSVCILCPFDTNGVAEAEAQINEAYQSFHKHDEPCLSKHIEYGLPDLERVRTWLGKNFANTVALGQEHLANWKLFRILSLIENSPTAHASVSGERPTTLARALLDWLPHDNQEPCYRHLLVASAKQLKAGAALEKDQASASNLSVLLMYMSLQASAHRAAYENLVKYLADERQRESQSFDDALKKLAVELREKETSAEHFVQELRERDITIENQKAALDQMQQQMNTILHSRGWRLLSVYYRLRATISGR